MIFDVTLDPANGAGLNWLHENAEIMGKDTEPNGIIHVKVRLPPERVGVCSAESFMPPQPDAHEEAARPRFALAL